MAMFKYIIPLCMLVPVIYTAFLYALQFVRERKRASIRNYMDMNGFTRYYHLDQFTFDLMFFWVKTVNGVEVKFYESTLFEKSMRDVKEYVEHGIKRALRGVRA